MVWNISIVDCVCSQNGQRGVLTELRRSYLFQSQSLDFAFIDCVVCGATTAVDNIFAGKWNIFTILLPYHVPVPSKGAPGDGDTVILDCSVFWRWYGDRWWYPPKDLGDMVISLFLVIHDIRPKNLMILPWFGDIDGKFIQEHKFMIFWYYRNCLVIISPISPYYGDIGRTFWWYIDI